MNAHNTDARSATGRQRIVNDRAAPGSQGENCKHGADPYSCPTCEKEANQRVQEKREAENEEWDYETTKQRQEEGMQYINDNYDRLQGNPRMKQIVEDAMGWSLDTLNHHINRHGLDGD